MIIRQSQPFNTPNTGLTDPPHTQHSHPTQSAVFGEETPYDNTPLQYHYAINYNNASITAVPDNSTLYFQLDDYKCSPTEPISRSYQVSIFQAYNLSQADDETPEAQRLCWKATPGYGEAGLPLVDVR